MTKIYVLLIICFTCVVVNATKEEAPYQAAALTSVLGSNQIDSSVSFGGSSSSQSQSNSNPEIDRINAEYDGQIESAKKKIKLLRNAIKETQKCVGRLKEQRAQLEAIEHQVEHLRKEKEKAILQEKLRKQMRDLEEINHMSRSLQGKFAELKRTQQLIKARMHGTRSSLNQLDNDGSMDLGDIKDSSKRLGLKMARMHKNEAQILHGSHKSNAKRVSSTLDSLNSIQGAIDSEADRAAKLLAKQIAKASGKSKK